MILDLIKLNDFASFKVDSAKICKVMYLCLCDLSHTKYTWFCIIFMNTLWQILGHCKSKTAAPVLRAADIELTTAKIILESKQIEDDEKIQYKLKYAVDNEETKEVVDLTEIAEIDTNEYLLTNLQQNTKYLVIASM